MLVRRVWPGRPTFESPFGDFDRVRREMLRLLDSSSGAYNDAGVFPPLNITQDDDAFYVRAEVPGIDVKQLSITALRNRVTVAGKRELAHEQERVSYHRKERAEGSFNRTVTLPSHIDTNRVVNPLKERISGDGRDLGLRLDRLEWIAQP